jgi:amino acid transporter
VLLAYGVVLLSHAVLNHVGVRVIGALNRVSAFYHLVGGAVIVAVLAVWAPLRAPAFLLTRVTVPGRGYGYGFAVGLLQAAWTFTGYDASAHLTEETLDASRNAPRAILHSVVVAAVSGFALLLFITLAIGDLGGARAADGALAFILTSALGTHLGRALLLLAAGAMWFCGLASVTSCSRMLFALGRDKGTPAPSQVARVSSRFQTPHVAIWICASGAFLLVLEAHAYSAVVALSTIALYASYGLPILLAARARRKGLLPLTGPWTLGRAGGWANAVAVVWVLTAIVLFVLPPNEEAGIVLAAALAALAAYWALSMRHRFEGPALVRQGDAR